MSFLVVTQSASAYEEVSCSSDAAFEANACSQCFDGETSAVGDTRGLLSDMWENTSGASQLLYKEEQTMPQIIALGGASWKEVMASDDVEFWQYTPALDALFSADESGYVLADGQSVTWIESSLGSAYELTANPAADGENIGIIAYDIATHALDDTGNIDVDTDSHRECVLIKSASAATPVTPTNPETPTELPQTGPEHVFLFVLAILLASGFFYFRRKA